MARYKVAILITAILHSLLEISESQNTCKESMRSMEESYKQCKGSKCHDNIQTDVLVLWLNTGCSLGIGNKRLGVPGMERLYTVYEKESPSETPLTVKLPDMIISKGPISVFKSSKGQTTCQEMIGQLDEKYKQCIVPECYDEIQTETIKVWMNSECSIGVSNRKLGTFGPELTYTVNEVKSTSNNPLIATLPDVLINKIDLHGNDDFTKYCLLKVMALDWSFKDCNLKSCYQSISVTTTKLFKKGCLWTMKESETGQREDYRGPTYFYETFDYRMFGCGVVLLPDIWRDGTAFKNRIKPEEDEPATEYDEKKCGVKEIGKRFDTCRTQSCFDNMKDEVRRLFKRKCVSFARQWEEYELTPKAFGPTYYYYTSFGYINAVALPDIWMEQVITEDPNRECTKNKMIMKT